MKNIFYFIFIFANTSWATPCAPRLSQCAYYTCLGQSMACGPRSLVQKIAAPYCQKFVAERAAYSPYGQEVLAKIKICLQKEIEAAKPVTCGQADDEFIRAHVACYHQSGFCQLPFADKLRLGRVAKATLLDPRFQSSIWRIQASCLGH